MPLLPALFRRSLGPAIFAAAIMSLGVGCATVSSTAPAKPLVAGNWQLDRSASELVETKVDAAVSAWEAKLRKRGGFFDPGSPGNGGFGGRGGRRGGGGPGGGGPGGGGPGGGAPGGDSQLGDASTDGSGEEIDLARPLAPDFAGIRRRLMQVLTPPQLIRFEIGSDYVRIAPDSIPPRDYHTDEEFSRIDEYGTARIDAGWSGEAFELQARYSSHAVLIERYVVDAHTNTMTVTYHLTDPMVGKVDVTSVYHRG